MATSTPAPSYYGNSGGGFGGGGGMTQIQQMVRGGRGKEWNLIVLERDEGSKLCIYSSGFLFIRLY